MQIAIIQQKPRNLILENFIQYLLSFSRHVEINCPRKTSYQCKSMTEIKCKTQMGG